MARITANVAFNMYDFITQSSLMEFFEFGEVITHTSTSFVIRETYDGGTETLALTGSFGGYTDEGIPTTGTVTGGSFALNGTTLFSFADASIPVTDGGNPSFTWFVELDDMEGLFAFLLRHDDELIGSNGDDDLQSLGGNDTLDGRAGSDDMAGGSGNDSYHVDSYGDRVFEGFGAGTDIVYTTMTTEGLSVNVENLTYTGSSDFVGFGNSLNNVIRSSSGNDSLDGNGGTADTLIGGQGNDTYTIRSTGDVIVEDAANGGVDHAMSGVTFTLNDNVERLTLTGTAVINGTGNSIANEIYGNSSANILDGGGGADLLIGNGGDDHYVVDDAGDEIVEGAGAGIDIVESGVTFTLSANVENLTLSGTNSVNATGNALANSIVGNAGSNLINGGLGADTMVGGFGNDTYFVDNSADQVVETYVDGGIDTVYSIAATYALLNSTDFGQVENLTYTGSGSFTGTGNWLANVIRGNGGNDRLDGGAGADKLYGGGGHDTYYVDDASDRVYEVSATGGTDMVFSSVTSALAANVERLTLTGTAALRAYGNELNNVITGNDGANLIDGRLGADAMSGGLGNDVYYVDNAYDRVYETDAAGGTDAVFSSVNFTMGANVERLTLTGTAGARGTGNEIANVIVGNDGNNLIDGLAGADSMAGGLGNDSYYVDSTGDRVIEAAGGGTDFVFSSVAFTLAANVERLVLTGTAAVSATGNALANALTGNAGANRLSGLDGADTLIGGAGDDQLRGGAGNDRLTGGAGLDKFIFDAAIGSSNVDAIVDFRAADDSIYLDQSFFGALALGTLSSSAFVVGTAAADAGDRIIYNADIGRIYYDADGAGGAAPVLFAQVTVGTSLTNADFYIVG